MRVLALLLIPAVFSQPDPERTAKARELITGTADILSSAAPDIQIVALLEMADLYRDIDRQKSVEWLEQASSLCGSLAPSGSNTWYNTDLKSRVLKLLAALDPDKAIENMAAGADREAIESLVSTFSGAKNHERAYKVIEQFSGQGAFPFRSAPGLMKGFAEDDPRRASLFAMAAMEYRSRPNHRTFARFIAATWRMAPRSLVEPAAKSLVTAIVDQKPPEFDHVSSLSGPKGSVSFETDADTTLFEVIHVLRDVDARLATEILDKRPALREASERFPQGIDSLRGGPEGSISSFNTGRKRGETISAAMQAWSRNAAAMNTARDTAVSLATTDPQKAIEKAKEIPDARARTQTLVAIANVVAEKDAATASSVLGQCITQLSEMDIVDESIDGWAPILQAAARAKNMELARAATEKALGDIAIVLQADRNADDPNTGPKEQWPSFSHLRNIMAGTAKATGLEAESLLAKLLDPDQLLLARLAIARGWLEKPAAGTSTTRNRKTTAKRKQ